MARRRSSSRIRHVSLGEVWGPQASHLREQLMECVSHKQMFALLEIELLKRLQSARVVHPAIGFALKSFRSGEPLPRVAHVQRATGYAERRFTEMFKQTVGLTPKRYARVLRLKAALKDLSQRTRSLADVADSNGYFDQAHFANECREIAGFSPSEYKPMARSTLHMELPYEEPGKGTSNLMKDSGQDSIAPRKRIEFARA